MGREKRRKGWRHEAALRTRRRSLPSLALPPCPLLSPPLAVHPTIATTPPAKPISGHPYWRLFLQGWGVATVCSWH
jgi:hypothetical protein